MKGLFLLMVLGIALVPASANLLVYGVANYSEVILPEGSYVHQGENITQGLYYDLSGVYGFYGRVSHWSNDVNSGITRPDYVVNLDHPEKTFISPSVFPAGRWYQYDGDEYCRIDSLCSSGFGNGNSYVFYVVENITPTAPVISTPEETVNTRVTLISFDESGQHTVEAEMNIPEGQQITAMPTPIDPVPLETILLPVATTEATPEITIPAQVGESKTEAGGVEVVTPKAPLYSIFAIISLLVVLCLRH